MSSDRAAVLFPRFMARFESVLQAGKHGVKACATPHS